MRKITITAAAVAAGSVALTGCGAAEGAVRSAAQAATPWQDTLRDYMDGEFADVTNADISEMCLGLSMLGIDTPAEIGSLALALDENGEIPPVNMTLDEFAEQEDVFLPLNLPGDLTVREVVDEAGAYMLDMCGVTQ